MCLGGGSAPAPPPLPPAPPAPLPPDPPLPPPDPVATDINPKVNKAKKERGSKAQGEFNKGTGSLRIKINPKLNKQYTNAQSGGLNP